MATEKEIIPTTRQVSSRLTIFETTERRETGEAKAIASKRNETVKETTFEGQRQTQTSRRQKEEGWKKEVTTNNREDQQGKILPENSPPEKKKNGQDSSLKKKNHLL